MVNGFGKNNMTDEQIKSMIFDIIKTVDYDISKDFDPELS